MINRTLILGRLASFAVVVILLSAFVFSKLEAGIEFSPDDFTTSKTKAKKEKKLIFMDAYAVWCGPCKKMAANVFTDPEVGTYFNKNFINLKMDMEKGEGPALRQTYGVQYYPTLFFLDHNGTVVKKVIGYQSKEQLLAIAKELQ
jgi:thiol:disulfide interchange protein